MAKKKDSTKTDTKVSIIKDKEKEKALEATINNLEKNFGKGTIMFMKDKPNVDIGVIPTGCLSIDNALGIGGIPRGRVTEVFGPEMSGKTTLCLHIIAQAQKLGGLAAFVDAEHALDINYAANIGVDVPNLLMSQPDYGEQALEVVEALVRSSSVDIIVVDSVAALTPRAEIEGEMGDAPMAMQARLMSQALRKLTAIVSKSNTAVIFINQLRMKIGMVFGNPETTTGGNALKFYSSVRIDIRKIAAIKEGDIIIGNRTKVKIVKSKVSTPFKQVEIEIINPNGIDIVGDILDTGVKHGVVKKSGAWYTYGEDRFQGRNNLRDFLKTDPVFLSKFKEEVITAVKEKVVAAKEPQVFPELV